MNPLPQIMEVLIFSFSNSVYCLLKGLAKTQVWLSLCMQLWVQQIWVTQPVAKAFLEEVAINPTIQVPSRWPTNTEQLYQRNSHTVKKVLLPTTDFPTYGSGKETENPREFDFGGQWDLIIEFTQDWETDSCGAQTKPCVHQDPGERSSDPTRDWHRLACECTWVSGTGVGWRWAAAGSGTLSAAVLAQAALKVTIIFHISTVVWSQVK